MKELFKIPEEMKKELSDNEVKSLESVANHLTDTLAEQMKNQNVDIDKLQEQLKAKGLELGVSEERLKKMEATIERQADRIKSIQTNGVHPTGAALNRIKSEFYQNHHKLKSASENNRVTLVDRVKAIDEHNPNLIITTENAVTTTQTTDWLFEVFGQRNDPFRIRRPIEYIRSLINISQVQEVPEVFKFWEEGEETGSFAIVDENGLKPQVKVSLIQTTVEAQKVAGYIVVTEEVIKWRDRAWAAIQRLFRDKLEREYNRLLSASLETAAVNYPGTSLDGTYENPTDLDAIAAAAAAVESINFVPDTIVINPVDKWRLFTGKATTGEYLYAAFLMNGDTPSLYGFRVITSNYVPEGTFMIGESGTWYVEEESPTLRSGWVNDDMIHNRTTIVAELFFLSYIPSVNQGAWVKGNFADIKDALQKP